MHLFWNTVVPITLYSIALLSLIAISSSPGWWWTSTVSQPDTWLQPERERNAAVNQFNSPFHPFFPLSACHHSCFYKKHVTWSHQASVFPLVVQSLIIVHITGKKTQTNRQTDIPKSWLLFPSRWKMTSSFTSNISSFISEYITFRHPFTVPSNDNGFS